MRKTNPSATGLTRLVELGPRRPSALQRGQLWDQAIARIGKDEGEDARQAIRDVAEEIATV